MTDTKSVKVLKKEEVEKGNFGTVVELPYVPIVDEEAEANTQEVTVKLPNETKVTITKVAHSANKESFLVQSIVVKNHILKDLGLFAEAEGHEKELKKVQADIDKYYQPEEADQDQRTQQKYDKALEAYAKSEKLLDLKAWSRRCSTPFGRSSMRPLLVSSMISLHRNLASRRGLRYEV